MKRPVCVLFRVWPAAEPPEQPASSANSARQQATAHGSRQQRTAAGNSARQQATGSRPGQPTSGDGSRSRQSNFKVKLLYS